MTVAEVILWGRTIGAVSWDHEAELAHFEYTDDFVQSGIQVAPLTMPLGPRIYSFPSLSLDAFYGLPGLLADSIPDRFGNALIDAWLAREGRDATSFTPVERLCYTGSRGMGALEFRPALGPAATTAHPVQLDSLVELASDILSQRKDLAASFEEPERERALRDILRVGTSAGGARAKAIIAWNPDTNDVRSGQVNVPEGYSHWLLKFDGVSNNRDRELADPLGYGAVEFAYHRMAIAAGITMMPCRLLEENGRRHFMTRRFDRTDGGKRVHMQTLAAMGHFDLNHAGSTSYEQAFSILRQLEMNIDAVEELFRRMAFNVVARNQDDHVKNIAFLMDRGGKWSLSPAYDLTYSYNPTGAWTSRHQMTLNGKREDFDTGDFRACARTISMSRGRATEILEDVVRAVRAWPQHAAEARVPEEMAAKIGAAHRVAL